MKPELAKCALEFLNRVDLKATEVNVFLQVVSGLSQLANPPKANPVPASVATKKKK